MHFCLERCPMQQPPGNPAAAFLQVGVSGLFSMPPFIPACVTREPKSYCSCSCKQSESLVEQRGCCHGVHVVRTCTCWHLMSSRQGPLVRTLPSLGLGSPFKYYFDPRMADSRRYESVDVEAASSLVNSQSHTLLDVRLGFTESWIAGAAAEGSHEHFASTTSSGVHLLRDLRP